MEVEGGGRETGGFFSRAGSSEDLIFRLGFYSILFLSICLCKHSQIFAFSQLMAVILELDLVLVCSFLTINASVLNT